jgi:ketosteroid isomerase-like protein
MENETALVALYDAFNRRDIDGVLAGLAPGVEWPRAWEGDFVHGHDQVRDYWTRQWAEIDPTVSPTAFRNEDDGQVAVTVHQVVRDRAGAVLADQTVTHVYSFENNLVTGMRIRP